VQLFTLLAVSKSLSSFAWKPNSRIYWRNPPRRTRPHWSAAALPSPSDESHSVPSGCFSSWSITSTRCGLAFGDSL